MPAPPASLLNASQQLGTALGLAIFSAIAARTSAAHRVRPIGAAVIGMRATNSRGEPVIRPAGTHAAREQVPAPELAD
jgi:hypothetical protein